jgi:hypothetical protein
VKEEYKEMKGILPFPAKSLVLQTILTQWKRPDGGIGRRAGFKIQFQQWSVGSIPTPGTQ